MGASVNLVGQGSVVWTFDLPLAESFADQVRRGRLRAADEESAQLLAESGVFADPEPEAASTADADGPPPMVGAGSGRNAWAAYAEQLGIDVTAGMKKAEIVEAVKAAKAE